jgi:hypothetical protein
VLVYINNCKLHWFFRSLSFDLIRQLAWTAFDLWLHLFPPPLPLSPIYPGEIFLAALFIPKVPLETGASPKLFDTPYAPDEGTFHGSRIPYTYFIFYSRYLNFQVVFKF